MKSIEQILEGYINDLYADNAIKLHRFVNRIINKKFGGTTDKDMQSYYSIANEVISDMYNKKSYNPEKESFEAFLYKSLVYAFIDDYKKENRDKRVQKVEVEDENGEVKKVSIPTMSLDDQLSTENDLTHLDLLQSDIDVETVVLEKTREIYSDKMKKYLSKLSPLQKKVLILLSVKYKPKEIMDELHINNRKYYDCVEAIRSHRNISILY